MNDTRKPPLNPMLKLALDLGPLLLFFFANAKLGIFWATGMFMAAVLVSLVVSYVLIRRLPVIENHRLVGMVSEADLARRLPEDQLASFVERVYA